MYSIDICYYKFKYTLYAYPICVPQYWQSSLGAGVAGHASTQRSHAVAAAGAGEPALVRRDARHVMPPALWPPPLRHRAAGRAGKGADLQPVAGMHVVNRLFLFPVVGLFPLTAYAVASASATPGIAKITQNGIQQWFSALVSSHEHAAI